MSICWVYELNNVLLTLIIAISYIFMTDREGQRQKENKLKLNEIDF